MQGHSCLARVSASSPRALPVPGPHAIGCLATRAPPSHPSSHPSHSTPTDVSFGVVGSGQTVQASSGAAAAQYAILASPTPGATNSAARTGSPSAAG